MPARAYQCFRPRADPESQAPHDGFAEWYGYAEAEGCDVQPLIGQTKSPDAFQEWFGYPAEDVITPATAMYLPDRDPCSEQKDPSCRRLAMEATETTLKLVQSAIEERRSFLSSKHGAEAEELRAEIHQLKLQQTRLAQAVWSLHEEARN